MFMCLQLLIGIRDQSTFALVVGLMALTMVCGLATETWSRPDKRDADGYRGWVGDPVRTERIMMLERKQRAYRDRNLLLRPEHPVVYPYEQTVNRLPFQQRNEYENQTVPPAPPPLTYMERRELRDYARAYTQKLPLSHSFRTGLVGCPTRSAGPCTSRASSPASTTCGWRTRRCSTGYPTLCRGPSAQPPSGSPASRSCSGVSVGARLALAPNHTLVLTQPCASQISPDYYWKVRSPLQPAAHA